MSCRLKQGTGSIVKMSGRESCGNVSTVFGGGEGYYLHILCQAHLQIYFGSTRTPLFSDLREGEIRDWDKKLHIKLLYNYTWINSVPVML